MYMHATDQRNQERPIQRPMQSPYGSSLEFEFYKSMYENKQNTI